ncbi:MAG: hypothetical protein J6F31_01095 [Oscillospiraceae bacterium]|nr:hypothetical protein [Oscillospiraceae bacterium]
MSITKITSEEDFEDKVLDNEGKCLVIFTVKHCTPCEEIGKAAEKLCEEMPEKQIFTVDCSRLEGFRERYGIKGFPTSSAYSNGEQKASKLGLISRTALKELLS